jgi:hypothetical protein
MHEGVTKGEVRTPPPFSHGKRVVSIWLAAGGAWGVLSSMWMFSPGDGAVSVLVLFPFLLSVAAGALVWQKHSLGETLAALSLSLQVPSFRLGDVEYLFSVAGGLFVGIEGSELALDVRLGSRLVAALVEPAGSSGFFLNLVPIVLIVLLFQPARGAGAD